MQESLPQDPPPEPSDANSRYAEFAYYKSLIREVSEKLLDRDWRQIDEDFINPIGFELRLIIKELEKIGKRPKIESSAIRLYINEILDALTKAVVDLYEYLDIKYSVDSKSGTSNYTKINECRQQLSYAEAGIQSILDELAPDIAEDPPTSNNQASNYSGTFLAPPAAAVKKEGGFCEDTSRSGRGTQSPCLPC